MNSFMSNLSNATNYGMTWNGELSHKSTMNPVYDMFATGGAYRKRSDEDCILLFENAYEEDKSLALKCLFYFLTLYIYYIKNFLENQEKK